MITLGIESSCDEFAVAVLAGRKILSSVVASQIEEHKKFGGVAPEVASRLHAELALPTVKQALNEAAITPEQLDAVAYTKEPGLVGSLLVGASFAKSFAWALNIPAIGVNHLLAHLHVNHLTAEIAYPYLGLIVSGGHTVLVVMRDFLAYDVIGSTIDDACGESFDKIAKHFNWGFPGGPVIDKMAEDGDEMAFNFPYANLYKGDHRYDLSYSGLKNAVINQQDLFYVEGHLRRDVDIAASFQRAAIGILLAKAKKALKDFELTRVVIGGGVAANRYFRAKLGQIKQLSVYAPPLALCGDNGDMIAFLGSHMLAEGYQPAALTDGVASRVLSFKRGLKG